MTINETNGITVNGQTVNSLIVNANGTINTGAAVSVAGQLTFNAIGATSDVSLGHNITGTTGVTLNAGRTITQTGGTKVNGGGLAVNFVSGNVSLVTNVDSLSSSAAGQSLIVTEDDGIDVGNITLNSLTVNAGRVASGNINTTTAISVAGDLVLDTLDGVVALNNDVNGTNSVTLNGDDGVVDFGGIISGGLLTIHSDNSVTTLRTNVAQLRVVNSAAVYFDEADGIEILDVNASFFRVTAGTFAAGNLTTSGTITVGDSVNPLECRRNFRHYLGQQYKCTEYSGIAHCR